MKKVKLIKTLTVATPVLLTPLVAASCNSNGNSGKGTPVSPKTPNTIYAGTGNGVAVGSIVNNTWKFTNYDLGYNNSYGVAASNNGNKVFVATENPSTFGYGGVQIGTKQSNGSYRFRKYTRTDGLISNDDKAMACTTDGSTIFVGTENGISIGTATGNTYNFQNYGKSVLGNNYYIYDISATPNGNIIAAVTSKYTLIGTKQSNGSYNFRSYSGGVRYPRSYGVYITPNAEKVYVCNNSDDLIVGTKSKSGYSFSKVNATGLSRNTLYSVYATPNNQHIFVGTDGFNGRTGLSVGNANYKFTNYTEKDGLGGATVRGIYGSPDGKTIYAGTNDGVSVGKIIDNRYVFTNYTAGLGSDNIYSIYANYVQ